LEDSRNVEEVAEELASEARNELVLQGVPAARVRVERRAHLKYDGTDTALIVNLGPVEKMLAEFEAAYRQQFSFLMPGRALVAEAVSVEAIAGGERPAEKALADRSGARPVEAVRIFTGGRWHETPLYRREALAAGQRID